MALTTPPTGLPSQAEGPNQEFKDELNRLIDEQLLQQQPGSPRSANGTATTTEGR
jgi:hypothetical protein